jgi:hypothetical protein
MNRRTRLDTCSKQRSTASVPGNEDRSGIKISYRQPSSVDRPMRRFIMCARDEPFRLVDRRGTKPEQFHRLTEENPPDQLRRRRAARQDHRWGRLPCRSRN